MGMLPPDSKLGNATKRPLWSGTTPSVTVPPMTAPLDPTMQGGSRTQRGASAGPNSEDFATRPGSGAPRGPASGGGAGAGSSGEPRSSSGRPMVFVTPNQYVDPLLVERLRAKSRTGYGGTFLTGPRGVGGAG